MKKRLIFKKSSIFVAICLIFVTVSCASFRNWANQRPSGKVEDISLKTLSFNDMTLLLDFSVDNPYPVGLTVEKIEINATVDGNRLFQTATTNQFEIKSKGKKNNSFDITLFYSDLMRVVSNYMSVDSLNLKVDIKVTLKLPEIPGLPQHYEVPLTINRKIPTIRPGLNLSNLKIDLPSRNDVMKAVSAAGMSPLAVARVVALLAGQRSSQAEEDLKKLDLKFGVNFDVELFNRASTPFTLSDFNYKVKFNGIDFMQGVTNNIRNEGSRSIVSLGNVFSTRNFHGALVSLATSRSAAFDVSGSTSIDMGSEFMNKPIVIAFGEKETVSR